MVTAEFFAGTVEDTEGSAQRGHQAEHGTTECRFPGAVGADHPDKFRFRNGQGDVLQGHDTGKTEGGMVETNNGMGHARRCTLKMLVCRSMSGWLRRSGLLKRLGQLEHIIAEHVEVGLGPRYASGQGRQHGDAGTGFPRQQLWNLLIQLYLGDNHADVVSFDGFDQCV